MFYSMMCWLIYSLSAINWSGLQFEQSSTLRNLNIPFVMVLYGVQHYRLIFLLRFVDYKICIRIFSVYTHSVCFSNIF